MLQHPFHQTFHLFLSHLLRPFKLPRGQQFRHAHFLHEPPVRAVRRRHEPRQPKRQLLGEGEDGAGRERQVVALEDVAGDFGGGDDQEAAGGSKAEEEEGAVRGGEGVERGVEG